MVLNLLFFSGLAILYLLGITIWNFFAIYWHGKRVTKDYYSKKFEYRDVDRNKHSWFLSDIAVQKYSQEVDQLGADYLATVQEEERGAEEIEGGEIRMLLNIYQIDQGRTTLALYGSESDEVLENSPAYVTCSLHTYFESGEQLSTNNFPPAFGRGLNLPWHCLRLPEITNIGELLANHRRAIEQRQQSGDQPLRLTSKESLDCLEKNHKDLSRAVKQQGYFSLLDALLWTFEWDQNHKGHK